MRIFQNSYVSKLGARLADLLEDRPGRRLPEPLGAYEKARINRLLNEVNAGRMNPRRRSAGDSRCMDCGVRAAPVSAVAKALDLCEIAGISDDHRSSAEL
jgi:hypothetical protein